MRRRALALLFVAFAVVATVAPVSAQPDERLATARQLQKEANLCARPRASTNSASNRLRSRATKNTQKMQSCSSQRPRRAFTMTGTRSPAALLRCR